MVMPRTAVLCHGERMSLFQFSRNDNPAPRKRLTPIVSVGATDQITATILSESVWGLDTHWWRGSTVPHDQTPGQCAYCIEKAPMKWRGFLYAFLRGRNELAFIELTDFAFQRLRKEAEGRETLRGLIIGLHRERKTVKAPVVIAIVGEEPAGKTLPKSRTPEETLKRLWKLPG